MSLLCPWTAAEAEPTNGPRWRAEESGHRRAASSCDSSRGMDRVAKSAGSGPGAVSPAGAGTGNWLRAASHRSASRCCLSSWCAHPLGAAADCCAVLHRSVRKLDHHRLHLKSSHTDRRGEAHTPNQAHVRNMGRTGRNRTLADLICHKRCCRPQACTHQSSRSSSRNGTICQGNRARLPERQSLACSRETGDPLRYTHLQPSRATTAGPQRTQRQGQTQSAYQSGTALSVGSRESNG